MHSATMLSFGKSGRGNVLAIFLCYFMLTDLVNNFVVVQCQPHHNKTENDAPEIFPNSSVEANGKKIYQNPTNLTSNLCVGTLMKAVSKFVVNKNIEKNKSGKLFSKVRDTYNQIMKNMTDNLLAALFDIESAYNYSNFEQCLSMIDMPATESEHQTKSSNSFLVPVLLVIILVLLSYVAFLYQKLRMLNYKNSNLLIEEE